MLKSSSSKSKKRNGAPVKHGSRTKSDRRAKARTGSIISSKQSNGYTKSSRNILDDKALDIALQQAIDQKNQRDYAGAIQTLAKVLSARPDSVRALFLTGGIWLSLLNDPKKALPFFKRATQLAPRFERVSLGLFHSLWDLGREKAAIREIKRFQSVAHCADYDEITAELKEKGLWS